MRDFFTPQRLKKHASQGWRFVIVGGTGACIDIGTQRLIVQSWPTEDMIAVYVATIVSTLLSVCVVFMLNKFFTFKSAGKVKQEGRRFALVYGVSITTNIAITSFLAWMGMHYTLAKIIAIGIGVMWNYLMSHSFIFKQKKGDIAAEEVVVF